MTSGRVWSTATDGAEWATSQRWADATDRLAGIDALHEELAAWTAGFDDRELAELLQRHGVAAAPVLNVADLLGGPALPGPRDVHRGAPSARVSTRPSTART